ncbi:DUF3734 domain-containing protein [Ancylobacter dichloromethanicus]
MGDGAATTITRFVRQGRDREPASLDYDFFSYKSIQAHQAEGYAVARRVIRGGSP